MWKFGLPGAFLVKVIPIDFHVDKFIPFKGDGNPDDYYALHVHVRS